MSKSRNLLFLVVLVVILASGIFIAPTILLSHNTDSGVNEECEVDEEVIEEQVEVALRSQFYENLGQVANPDIKFYGNIPGGMIGFAERRILLWMEDAVGTVTLYFEGARDVAPVGVNEVSHRTNYFLGDRGTYTNIQGFSTVVYEDLWFGIDLVYQTTVDGAKYEFLVAPGANPAVIRVRCEGSDSLDIGETSVRIEKGDAAVVDDGLRVFQGVTDVEGEFISLGGGVFGFHVGDYDKSKLLVIDPLLYSTYVSGSDDDVGYGIAIDSSGNTYVTGSTGSTDFPTNIGAYNETGDGTSNYDVFVFKLSSDGNSLLYSTYVGGSDDDVGYGIVIDSSLNAYVTGYTKSTDFPTNIGAYNETGDGTSKRDVFVFKLSSTGGSLSYSTYVSGSDDDVGYGIAIDIYLNAYVTGYTESTDFPTKNYYNSTGDGSTLVKDVFVFKLFEFGNSLYYSTYVSGSDDDVGYGIVIDGAGVAYVTGYTYSIDFPTVNAFNATGDGSTITSDVFVFKLADNGGSLLYSTYVGGSEYDLSRDIAVDSSGNVYVTGYTYSIDFPTVNAFNATGDGSTITSDVFVFKLSSSGNSLFYSTYVGGSDDDDSYGIAVDISDNAYVAGYTESTDYPTVNPYNSTGDGSTSYKDVFVLKLSEDHTNPDLDSPSDFPYEQGTTGNQITWTAGDMTPSQYRVDGNGSTVGWTTWSNGSIIVDVDGHTPGVYNYTITVVDDWDNEARDTVFVIVEDTTSPDLDSPPDFTYRAGYVGHQIVWTVDDLNPDVYRIDGNGTPVDWTIWSAGTIVEVVDGLSVGIYNFTITVMDDYGNYAVDTVFVTVVDNISPDLDSPADILYEAGDTGYQIVWTVGDVNPGEYRIDGNGTPVDWTSWSNGTIPVNVDGHTPGVYNYTIIVRDDYGNQATDTVIITVEDTTPPDLDHPVNIQYEEEETGNTITWSPSDLYPATYEILKNGTEVRSGPWDGLDISINVDNQAFGVHNYTLIVVDDSGNTAKDTVFVTVTDFTAPVIDPPTDIEYEFGETGNSITWQPTENNPASYEILKNGSLESESDNWDGSSIIINVDELAIGLYNFTLTVWDKSGNNASDTVMVTVTPSISDTTGPAINTTLSTELPITPEDIVTVIAAVTDESGIDDVILSYSTDGETTWTNVTMTFLNGDDWTADIPQQSEDTTVHYKVHANDSKGNWGTSMTNYYTVVPIDTTGPSIGLSHSPSPPTELDDVVVTATISDDSSIAIVTLQYSIDSWETWTNVTMTQSGGQWTAPIPKQAVDTVVSYRVHAMDSEGNWATSSDSYVVVSSIPPPDVPGTIILVGELITAIVGIVGAYKGFKIWQRRRGLGKVPIQNVK